MTFNLEIRSSKRGAVLLEVVLALTLFAAAAAVVGAAIHAAITGVERQKLEAHAANLAITVLSEIQMGLRTVESLGPDTFESPFEQWSWQLVLTATENEAGESSDLTRVEVIVRHDEPVLVRRLTQVIKLPKKNSLTNRERTTVKRNHSPGVKGQGELLAIAASTF